MASKVDLTLNENNDENIKPIITTNNPTSGTALDISTATIEAFLKVNAATADGDGSTWKGSTATGEVVVTDGPNGKCTISVPAAAVTTSKGWWRVDVLVSGKRKTAVYGQITVTDL